MEMYFETSAEFTVKAVADYFKDWIDAETERGYNRTVDSALKAYKLAVEQKRLLEVIAEHMETENEKKNMEIFLEEARDLEDYWKRQARYKLENYSI